MKHDDIAVVFIETPKFAQQIKKIATEDELKKLRNDLVENPERGSLIKNTGGLRKTRMAIRNRGKSGGARIIYFLANKEIIYLVMAYQKSTKDNLSEAEKADLRKLVSLLKNEV